MVIAASCCAYSRPPTTGTISNRSDYCIDDTFFNNFMESCATDALEDSQFSAFKASFSNKPDFCDPEKIQTSTFKGYLPSSASLSHTHPSPIITANTIHQPHPPQPTV
jgi:hypothetical protein